MIGTKIYKENYDQELYQQCADYCNETQTATIEDKGKYFEVVAMTEPTADEIKKFLTDGVQAYMNATAQEKNYDDIFTAISYENSDDEIFAKEGKACRIWRDKVWRTCYNILDEVLAGTREIPTLEELIAELPKIEW